MKHFLHTFIITQLIITASSTYAMETIELHMPQFIKLTAVQQPHQALYLTNDTALVLHKNGCSIVDTNKNTEIKKICDHPNPLWTSGIALHPNKNKMAFFYHTNRSETSKIAIYDLAAGKKEWSKKENAASIIHASFNSIDDTLAIGRETTVQIYNYKTNEARYVDIESLHEDNIRITIKLLQFHPTKSHKLYVKKNRLNYINLTNNQLKISSSGLYTYEFHTKESHKAKYTCDKVIISISNLSEKYKTTINYRKNCSESAIRQVQFHPNDAIVTILDRGNHITYWDIATGTMMCKTISLPTDNEYYTSPYLSFSPDGTNVMLTLYNADYGSCMIIPTPFKVKHAHQLPYFLLLLQNINQHDQLPAEVACLIMQELLKL